MKHVAIIWGHPNKIDALWTTQHQFWEATLHEYHDIEVHRYDWGNWHTMPTGYDLYFFVTFHNSLYQICDTKYHPRVFYWWDSFHHSLSYPAQLTELFDISYFAEKLNVESLRNVGVSKVRWLPGAYYPGVHRPLSTNRVHDWAFVGQLDSVVKRNGYTRYELVSKLVSEKYKGFYSPSLYGDDINIVYNESKILFDRGIFYNLGTRFFEVIGSGCFLLTNRTKIPNGIDEIACDGRHFITYDDTYADFIEKFRYYLAADSEREKIAKNAEEYFRDRHTYKHRLDQIFRDVGL